MPSSGSVACCNSRPISAITFCGRPLPGCLLQRLLIAVQDAALEVEDRAAERRVGAEIDAENLES